VSIWLVGKHGVKRKIWVAAIGSRYPRARDRSSTPRSNFIAKASGMQFTSRQFGVEIQDQLMAIRQGRGQLGWSTAHGASSRGRGLFQASQSQGPLSFVSTQESTDGFERDRYLAGSGSACR
jgi:hypothetical protein